MIGAVRVGLIAGGIAFAWLLAHAEPVTSRCVPLVGQPGATVCGGRVDEGIAWAAAAPTMEVVVAEPLPKEIPAPDYGAPLPAWMPAGVLTHEETIRQAARDVGLDPLVLAILAAIECPSGNAACTSYVGARGLAQIMPQTAVTLEMQTGYPCTSMAHDPLTSLRCGASYFVQGMRAASELWRPGKEVDAIGAAGIGYNAGNGMIPRVVQHVQAGGYVCDAPVPAESRRWCSMARDMWEKAGRQ